MLALHLLQISLVYVNTLMIQDVLRDPVWLARLTAEDWVSWVARRHFGTAEPGNVNS
jgi:hypothetical protein